LRQKTAHLLFQLKISLKQNPMLSSPLVLFLDRVYVLCNESSSKRMDGA